MAHGPIVKSCQHMNGEMLLSPDVAFAGVVFAHVGFADPVCLVMKDMLQQACEKVGCTFHNGGTYVNMEGPAFSTRAESNMHRSWGASVIGMTNMTEARLAREAEISFGALAMSTDYDCWKDDEEDVTVEQVMATMRANVSTAKEVIAAIAPLVRDYKGSKPPAQTALNNGGAIMTARDKIPPARAKALECLIGEYL